MAVSRLATVRGGRVPSGNVELLALRRKGIASESRTHAGR
jgi:hypothetical protein